MKAIFNWHCLALLPVLLSGASYAQHNIYPIPMDNCIGLSQNLISVSNPLTNYSCIVAGFPGYPIDISGNRQVSLEAGERIQLKPNFRAHSFSNTGSFKASIKQGEIGLAVFSPDVIGSGYEVSKYEKLEIGIRLPYNIRVAVEQFVDNHPGINPFDPDQIDVKAEFSVFDDQNQTWSSPQTIYGFYYNEFKRITSDPDADNWYWQRDTSSYTFRVRFAPPEFGYWRCKITANVPGYGFFEANDFYFGCSTTHPDYKGFMEIGNSKKYFRLSNGDFFFPAGQNMPAPLCHGCTDVHGVDPVTGISAEDYNSYSVKPKAYLVYHDELTQLQQAGGNYFRMFFTPWAVDIEFEKLNNYSGRMTNAWEMDRILDKALDLGLLMHLNLKYHVTHEDPGFYGHIFWDWSANTCDAVLPWIIDPGYCYNSELGLASPIDFFTDPDAVKQYKKKIRYIIARWGYSQNIAAIELFSEINNAGKTFEWEALPDDPATSDYDPKCERISDTPLTDPYTNNPNVPEIIEDWHDEMSRYIKVDLQHRNHLISVSYAGPPSNTDQSFQKNYIDIQSFSYYSGDRSGGYVQHAYDYTITSGFGPGGTAYQNYKPFMNTESGWPGFSECGQYAEWVKTLWISAFSGHGGAAINWDGHYNNPWWGQFGNLLNFINGIDFDDDDWFPYYQVRDDNTASDNLSELNYLFNYNDEKAIGVITNRTYNYWSMATDPSCKTISPGDDLEVITDVNASTFAAGRLQIINLPAVKRFNIDWYDAISGQLISSEDRLTNLQGELTLEHPKLELVNNFRPIIAFKIYPHGGSFIPHTPSNIKSDKELTNIYSEQNSTLNIQEVVIDEFGFELFPNPSREFCTIDLQNVQGESQIKLYDCTGKLLFQQVFSGNQYTLTTMNYAPGIYFVELSSSGNSTRKKLIINSR